MTGFYPLMETLELSGASSPTFYLVHSRVTVRLITVRLHISSMEKTDAKASNTLVKKHFLENFLHFILYMYQ